jgi:hypothetical protein
LTVRTREEAYMILMSLMLAATATPLLKPGVGERREAVRPDAERRSARSRRLIELEAAVRSLPMASAETERDTGPSGM